jgi:pimeloyl-ACP methyl ester carboxylesterase
VVELNITDHRGLKLAAVYHEPATSGPHPLVILLHGFTGYKEEGHIVSLAELLVTNGIAALRFDAPGSGESEGSWEHDYRLTNYLEDIIDVINYSKTSLNVNPLRMAIWGHSMGGFVALAAASRLEGNFQALACSQPSSGWKLLSTESELSWRTTGWAEFKNSRFPLIRLPYDFLIDRNQYDALTEAPSLKLPALFIAGTQDIDVPALTVQKIYNAAPEPKTYLEFDVDHGYKHNPEMLDQINTATVNFFSKYLLNL